MSVRLKERSFFNFFFQEIQPRYESHFPEITLSNIGFMPEMEYMDYEVSVLEQLAAKSGTYTPIETLKRPTKIQLSLSSMEQIIPYLLHRLYGREYQEVHPLSDQALKAVYRGNLLHVFRSAIGAAQEMEKGRTLKQIFPTKQPMYLLPFETLFSHSRYDTTSPKDISKLWKMVSTTDLFISNRSLPMFQGMGFINYPSMVTYYKSREFQRFGSEYIDYVLSDELPQTNSDRSKQYFELDISMIFEELKLQLLLTLDHVTVNYAPNKEGTLVMKNIKATDLKSGRLHFYDPVSYEVFLHQTSLMDFAVLCATSSLASGKLETVTPPRPLILRPALRNFDTMKQHHAFSYLYTGSTPFQTLDFHHSEQSIQNFRQFLHLFSGAIYTYENDVRNLLSKLRKSRRKNR